MSLLIQQILGGLIRLALVPLAGWLTSHGILNADQQVQFYAEITAYVLGGGWVIWNAITRLRLLNTASASTKVQTVDEVREQVKSGAYAPASTPTSQVPSIQYLKGTGDGRILPLILLAAVLGGPIVSSGCATFKPNPTFTEQEQAREVGAKIARGIKRTAELMRTLQDTEIEFFRSPARPITDAEHKQIQGIFLTTFQIMDNGLTRLQSVTRMAELRITVDEIQRGLSDLSTALAIGHPQTAKILQAAAFGVGLAFELVASLLSGLEHAAFPVSQDTTRAFGLYIDLAFVFQEPALTGGPK